MAGTQDDVHRYDDIIDLPHHQSATRPHIPPSDRAAQFSPFAALTGYDARIRETARLTDQKPDLDEDAKAMLNEKLLLAQGREGERPEITVTYFVADEKKDGGAFVDLVGRIRRIDRIGRSVCMQDGTLIPLDDIVGIDGDLNEPIE